MSQFVEKGSEHSREGSDWVDDIKSHPLGRDSRGDEARQVYAKT
jgi:hypothetical protein